MTDNELKLMISENILNSPKQAISGWSFAKDECGESVGVLSDINKTLDLHVSQILIENTLSYIYGRVYNRIINTNVTMIYEYEHR